MTELSAAELAAEVKGSKDDLAALLGHAPVSFAYPYGDYNDAVLDLVRKEFDIAFSVEEGLNYLSQRPASAAASLYRPNDSLR